MIKEQNAELTASLEDYLEAILHIENKKDFVRSKDIVERLSVAGSSVTGALRALQSRELVHYKPYDGVTLTARGRSVAEDIARRHTVLRRFFVEVLAVDEGTADKGACTMEHAVPRAIVDRFIEFLRFLDTPPQDGQPWVRLFERFCSSGHGHMDVSADAESPGSQ